MKRISIVLCYLLFSVNYTYAQSLPAFKRNDNHATTLQSNNGGSMSAGLTSTGQVFVKEVEDPVDVVPGVADITLTETNPTVTNATSFTLLAANADRVDCEVQNNTAANICVSGEGNVLTGIVPTSTNNCVVLVPQAVFSCGAPYPTRSAITVYQTSGGNTNLITVSEKE